MSSESSETGRRRRSRLRVRLPARLVTRTDTQPVVLEDLSLHGARVATSTQLKLGSEAVLEWGNFEAFGEVVWCAGGRCGISFFDAVTPQMLLDTRDLDDATRLPQDKELARQNARQWAEGKIRL
ncbi:PilZ domain-containing protein [Novosphingobium sp.]|uniref:PilZ domain-containing protein n=3 Tax=Novosphingobium sp. TaxID=1874826 RepID=UPI002FD88078